MTTPVAEPRIPTVDQPQYDEKEKRKRRSLLILLLWLLLLFCCLGYFVLRYLLKPEPIPDMLPAPVSKNLNYPPAYKFFIAGVDGPVAVALSPDEKRVYVAESKGERLIKVFDLEGTLINSFAPHGTTASTRNPKYLAVDAKGNVYMTDRTNNVIHIFDADGKYIDAIIGPAMTISKFLAQNLPGGLQPGTTFYYEGINRIIYYQLPDKSLGQSSVPPAESAWAPLGLRFNAKGDLIYTDVTSELHSVNIIPAADLKGPLSTFTPLVSHFGEQGKEPGQLDFPNAVALDKRGNFYVSDGNNGRISFWISDLKYGSFFGFGSNEQSLNLPRGVWMDKKDHLHVVDAVGSTVRVYDVSGEEPAFLYSFGTFGASEGTFNFPNDIVIDGTGRLYIADRENNRIQVWSY
jgi:sugar lactone lactonase YvrE